MKKLIKVLLVCSLIGNVALIGANVKTEKIDKKPLKVDIEAYQVAPDGDCQVTFKDGTSIYFNLNQGLK